MAGSSQLGTRSFATFLPGDDLRDLRSVAHAKRAEAERKHRRFAQRRRDALRLLLLSAARYGALPHGRTRLADFDSSGKVTQTVFINLDEDLPGDNEFDPDAAATASAALPAASPTAPPTTAPAAPPAASPAAPPDASDASVPKGGNEDEGRPVVWCEYDPSDSQANGIADAYVRAKSPNKALHNVVMDVDLFLDLAGIRHLTQACTILSAACTRSVYFSAFFLAYLITHTR